MVQFSKIFAIILLSWLGECRNFWSEDLPLLPDVNIVEGEPIIPFKNYTRLEIRNLNGTLFSNTLSKLHQVKELKIGRNQIDKIEDGALCSAPSLTILEIDFSNNAKPPTLTRNTFKNCWPLKELLMKFEIGVDNSGLITDDALEDLTFLKKLALQGYKINHLQPHFLNLQSKYLKSLIISYAQIEKIDSDVFDKFEYLEDLYLTDNRNLTHLPRGLFKRLWRLKRLILNNNAIENLFWIEFKGLNSLKELFLVNNKISYLDANLIAKHMPKLKLLYLDDNPLLPSCKKIGDFISRLKENLKHTVTVSYKRNSGINSC